MSLLVRASESAASAPVPAAAQREHVAHEGRHPSRAPVIVFAVVCAGAAALRVWLLASGGIPSGVDAGNWLAYGRDLLGTDLRPDTLAYPPAVPLIVTAMVTLAGPALGAALVAGAASVAPAAGAFAVLQTAGLRWLAVLLGALLLPATAIGEMAAWGGYPQLLGAGLLAWSLVTFHRWLDGGRRRDLLVVAVLAVLVLATSHLTAAIGAMAALLMALSRGRRRAAITARRMLLAAGLALLAAIPLIGVYARIIPALAGAADAEPALTSIGAAELPSRLTQIHGGAWPVWALGLVAGLICLALVRGPRAGSLRAVFAAYAGSIAIASVIGGQPRLLYELALVGVLGFGVSAAFVLHEFRPAARALVGAGTAIALVAVTMGGFTEARQQQDQYQVLDADLVAAIDWIAQQTPDDALIAVGPAGDAPLGWWVEGLAERRSVYAAPLRWLTFPEERIQAAEANLIFFRAGFPSPAGLHWARARGIDFVLVPAGSGPDHPDSDLAPVFVNDGAAIYEITGDAS